ncbi:hexitol phosphatase HxpB [Shewanella intestini]|uniref:Hexitol phosphatase HxpB n=1 Tax=Shewanella intestini TaxID=2017544 RepID=A0ABS5I512_9GAMM|nr:MULTISPECIES: hexitol phosphatase HxpB [Shewanella]MBR9729113.1 hexitol phosphatase HxpB [Shewanella intestini]MRG37189.1 hexitol phosphatase HxpB [Shewanella sp. XMDDZSB0408]
MNIKAIIFDMDGVIIDSEPAWQAAELAVFNQLGLHLQPTDVEQTIGLRIDQVVDYWQQRKPWQPYNNQQTAQDITAKVVAYISEQGQALTGIEQALKWSKENGLKIGLATSSPRYIIDAVLEKLQLNNTFNAITSAEHLPYGKPHPEVYLNCASALNVNPQHCIAIEDSFNGLVAARAANMQTIAIPEARFAHESTWSIAHHQLKDANTISSTLTAYYHLG